MRSYELVVVGGGPAGVTAALRARELGATVALVERGNLGGTCVGDGCVPTRVLARAARLVRDSEKFASYGLEGDTPRVDFARLLSRTQHIVYAVQEKKQLRDRLEASGVEVFDRSGEVRFLAAHELALSDGTRLRGEKFVLCAGGHARRMELPGAEHALTHSDVWSMRELPESIAVVGGAATGCQLASVFAAFGARTWILDVAPRLLPGEDEAVSGEVAKAFAQRGIEVVTGTGGVERLEKKNRSFRLHYSLGGEERELEVGAVVFAVGWIGNLERLDLDAAGVETGRGYVRVDDSLRTSAPHVFAAGDITGRVMLVQSAAHEGELAAENAVLGSGRAPGHAVVPHGGFTDPEYASVGLTEVSARACHDVVVATVPYTELDRGIIDGRTGGLCKLIARREDRRILGAHIVGEQAVEIVQLVATAMRGGMKVEHLADLELAYPTFTAVIGLAARRILRDLGLVAVSPQWGIPEGTVGPEWERGGG